MVLGYDHWPAPWQRIDAGLSNDDKTQIELRKGIYLMPRLKIQSDCKHENNDENTRNNMIKSQYLKVNRHLTNLGEKKSPHQLTHVSVRGTTWMQKDYKS